MNKIINILRSRNLSLKGKITIIKTLIVPQINFLFSVIFIPDHIPQKLDKMLLDFISNSKSAKVKKSTIIAPVSKGEGMIDIYKVHSASKVSWITNCMTKQMLNGNQ